jgi:hypothetical protein
MIYLHCLQNAKELSETVSTSGKRKSIKESGFAASTQAELLKPIYKSYQAMPFASYGHSFKWDSPNRKVCVQMLLEAARECPAKYTSVSRKQWRQSALGAMARSCTSPCT